MIAPDAPKGGRLSCCFECRTRHIKCRTGAGARDCVHCLSHGYTCIRDTLQFRHGENPSIAPSRGSGKRQYEYAKCQVWMKTASKLVFIDETEELRTIYGHNLASTVAALLADAASQDISAATAAVAVDPSVALVESPTERPRPNLSAPPSRPSSQAMSTITSPTVYHTRSSSAPMPSHPTFQPSSASTSRWSLQNAQEAHLMQHYCTVIGAWMDVLDPSQHFTLVLPYRAANCPTLQQAIFALSARHLSRIGDFDPYISDQYSRKVIDEIFPLISGGGTDMTKDVDLLCATVVLRLLEELDVAYTGYDGERHLKGVQILMNAQIEDAMRNGGLQQAAICIALHQEITGALMSQRPIAPFLTLESAFDRSFAPADDRTWAFRIILHAMAVLSFCYTPAEEVVAQQDLKWRERRWKELMDYAMQWDALQPTHFKPMYEAPVAMGSESLFPVIYFHRPIHIMSAMHLHACLILLASHDPSLQTTPPTTTSSTPANGIASLRHAARALEQVENRIRFHIRAICGIAMCNKHLASAMIMSTAMVKLCGERFVGTSEERRREQSGIVEMLRVNEKVHGWPTKLVEKHLGGIWGWAEGEE